ncbi:hypothetical protein [Micromonospora zhanjiangensis]
MLRPRAGETPAWSWTGSAAEGFVRHHTYASQLILHWAGAPEIARRLVGAAAAGPGQPVPAQPGTPGPGHPVPAPAGPGQPASHPGQPASHPGQPALHPGQPALHPGQPAAHPAQPAAGAGQPAAGPAATGTGSAAVGDAPTDRPPGGPAPVVGA